MKPKRLITSTGILYMTEDGKHHRTDGPSRVFYNGNIWYEENDKLINHRPSHIARDGTISYLMPHGFSSHRTDGPAKIEPNGEEKYYRDGIPTDEYGHPLR